MDKNNIRLRDSNIELLRIVLMLMVITHHYVVNSGIVFFDNIEDISSISSQFAINTVIAQCIGWGGKVGINGFILITGYYMCKKEISICKWKSLLFEILLYNAIINGLFLIFHYEPHGRTDLLKGMFSLNLISGLSTGEDKFLSYYLLLYLLIPYINSMVKNLEKRLHRNLILILLFVYTGITTFSLGKINTFSALGCYVMIYVIGAYFGRFNHRLDSLKIGGIGIVSSLILIYVYIFLSDYCRIVLGMKMGGGYYPVDSMCKLLAVTMALSLFIFFKNLRIKQNQIINSVASTTLGVLCIHANSNTMRTFLWNDLFGVPYSQNYNSWLFMARSLTIPLIVFACTAIIDISRQNIIRVIKHKNRNTI